MLLDSNILIGYLNGDETIISSVDSWRDKGQALCISVITYTEVLSHPVLTDQEVRSVRSFLREFIELPVDRMIADEAASIRRKHRIGTPDAIIKS